MSQLLTVSEVSEFHDLLPKISLLLKTEALLFEGGRLQHFIDDWSVHFGPQNTESGIGSKN